MRLRNALALGVTAATTGTAVLALAVAPSVADPGPSPGPGTERQDQPPTCGKATDPEFPIDTRIHGGPRAYVPGDGFRTFAVDLTNTTTEACDSIHPVLALADRDRVLRPAQIRLDFYDSAARRWRPVAFEATEEDENVGVFTGFSGFAVPAGRTVTVSVRLAFVEGTAPNEVVANAAIVQRLGDDGDWVGESDDFRLTIAPEGAEATSEGNTEENGEGNTEENGEGNAEGTAGPTPRPTTTPPRADSTLPPTLATPELALTGKEFAAVLVPVSGALLLAGAALKLAQIRRRRRTGR
ncbi:hypothetical protein M5362_23385 [Streptomyces sp. Je 1-79]|uniref:hypothetical protein n=1 Tax=Streptomyces sp. Je 1-79 TaxID=2943847 RepID=UPI0021A6F021|nr:hypothetical protein [Streptomyces sp. Je 1-79]MCT4356085.1 hypothetical protein [Streptomyces sp. Je 1-79]